MRDGPPPWLFALLSVALFAVVLIPWALGMAYVMDRLTSGH